MKQKSLHQAMTDSAVDTTLAMVAARRTHADRCRFRTRIASTARRRVFVHDRGSNNDAGHQGKAAMQIALAGGQEAVFTARP
jgi:hypothetical protein